MLGFNIKNQLSKKLTLSYGKLLEKAPHYLQDYLKLHKYDVFGVYEIFNFGNKNYAWIVAYFDKEDTAKLVHQVFYTKDKTIKEGEIING